MDQWQSAQGTPVLNGVNKPLPLEPIDANAHMADDGAAMPTDSHKPPTWQRMRDQHERAVQEEVVVQ